MFAKPITWLYLISIAHADLVATIETETGGIANAPILVSLEFDTAPQAVANFIKLSQGTQKRIDSTTGAIVSDPMYIGEKFFRVINDPGFKIAQTGSGTGTNSGGPGYSFKDEFSPSVRHTPYVLSMANSGPNSNGSQIFFTGNVTIASLDDVHSIIGVITDTNSRAAIDNILSAGNDGSRITGISIAADPGDTGAENFDPNSQNLPCVEPVAGYLEVTPSDHCQLNLETATSAGDVFTVYRGTDLAAWSDQGNQHFGIDDAAVSSIHLDNAASPKAFYYLARIFHPDAHAPSHLRNRAVSTANGSEIHTYTFNADASGGTIIVQNSGGSFNGTFTLGFSNISAHQFSFIAYTSFEWSPHENTIPFTTFVKCGIDSSQPNSLSGHHGTSYYDYGTNAPKPAGFIPFSSGACSASR